MVKKNGTNDINESSQLPKRNSQDKAPYIVAIGASAGGLESLKSFFIHAVANIEISYVIVTHLSIDHVSVLPDLLQQYTSMKVSTINQNQKVQSNHIYVLPPGKNLVIHHGILELLEQEPSIHLKLPIDIFLSSLAEDQKQKAICIILSGMGSDGSIGIKAIREQGGVIIAQSTKSARYESMPQSAISTGVVDFILPPEEMFHFLLKYIARATDNTIVLDLCDANDIQQILLLLKNHTEHDFMLYKNNTIYRRIQKRLTILQINSLSAYIYYLHQHPSEVTILLQTLLINVTNFFRDPEAFEVLQQELLTLLNTNPKDNCIRVWVPGCSTGEEVYSIAILLKESMEQLKIYYSVQIFGTDIDEDAIHLARCGVYSKIIEANVSQERLARFFTKEGNFYKVNKDIRKMIIFANQNIIKDAPFTRLHLLSCRNLFIYLKSIAQKKILSLFHYSLNSKGILFLGTSENIGTASELFTVIDKRWKLFQRNETVSSYHHKLHLPRAFSWADKNSTKITEKMMPDIEPNLSNLIKNLLLKHYTPGCVVIDEHDNIVFAYGKTRKYLEFASGEIQVNLMGMIRPDLKSKLYIAIRKALEQQKEVVISALQLNDANESTYLNLRVKPLSISESIQQKLLLVIFEEMINVEPSNLSGSRALTKKDGKAIEHLEQELKYTKESLQMTIEELETSNEELKSSNEELQSTNEELQSTNEEIETSKEELHSLNEELTTVNMELEARIDQLSSANDDIKNLLDNTEIASIFLDKDLCIKRFTPKATEIINLIATDLGRPISHIVSNLNYEKLVEDARTVLKTLDPILSEAKDKNHHWYGIRIMPYRTINNMIDGVVITFLNIHAQKQAEEKLKRSENELLSVETFNHFLLNRISAAAIILNNENKVLFVNNSFINHFKLFEQEIIGHSIFKLEIQWDTEGLKTVLECIQHESPSIKDYKIAIFPHALSHITAHVNSFSSTLIFEQ